MDNHLENEVEHEMEAGVTYEYIVVDQHAHCGM